MNQPRKRTAPAAVLLATTLLAGAPRADDRPGDHFRQAALEHTKVSQEAVGHAAQANGRDAGRYLELAALYREMAAIKERAAVLADVDRWDEINWDRYRELEQQRDAMVSALHDRTEPNHAPDAGENTLASAAKTYRLQARDAGRNALHSEGAERAIFEELAVILSQMASIKDDASAREHGGAYDWTRYEALSERRDTLERMLDAARSHQTGKFSTSTRGAVSR